MAIRISPRIIRGRVFYQVPDVLFPTFRQAAGAWSAAVAHRLDIVDVGGTMMIAKPKKFTSRAEQRAARKRVETAMAKIAEEAFSDAFNRMFAVSVAEGAPRHSGDFLRWFLKAMRKYGESYPKW